MLIRISLIVAIVAGLATAGIGFTQLKTRLETTIQDRDTFEKERNDERASHSKTKKTLTETKETLDKTQKELTETTAQRDQFRGENEQLTQAKLRLTQERDEVKRQRDQANSQLNQWTLLGVTVDGVKKLQADNVQIAKQRDVYVAENKILAKKNLQLDEKIKALIGDDQPVELPEGLTGKVVAVDPKFDFVVLNIGGNAGVKERGELLVNRNGKLVAKLRISSVSPTHSIANILPEWKSNEAVMEGDQVLH